MPTLHIFNPETDIVLGLDRDSYTPPQTIRMFRSKFELLPSLYAENGDAILCPDSEISDNERIPFLDVVEIKGIDVICHDDLKSGKYYFDKIFPWGWNRQIKKSLSRFFSEDLLPSDSELKKIREISNRKTTIDFFSLYHDIYPDIAIPICFNDIDSASGYAEKMNNVCFKAPWSSSGRGIIFSGNIPKESLKKWLGGIIRGQGSVIAEPVYDRQMDFASEWGIESGEPTFIGFSLFDSSDRGKYLGNSLSSRQKIKELINKKVDNITAILENQRGFISKNISPYYSGPLGFDMLIDRNGTVNPCVCLLYTSDAADDLLCVDLGGRRIIKKKKKKRSTTDQQ